MAVMLEYCSRISLLMLINLMPFFFLEHNLHRVTEIVVVALKLLFVNTFYCKILFKS